MRRTLGRVLMLLAAAGPVAAWATQYEAPPACSRVDVGPLVRVSVGKSSVIRPQEAVRRIVLGNPLNSQGQAPREVAPNAPAVPMSGFDQGQGDARRPQVADVDVVLLSPREIYMLGKTIGSTNVVLVDESGVCTVLDVAVGMDTTTVASMIHELLPAERDLKVTSAADSLVLSGTVSDAAAADRALDIASAFVRRANTAGSGPTSGRPGEINERIVNLMTVGSPQQVLLEVKVAEVSKTVLDQFGINLAHAYLSGGGSTINFLTGIFGGNGFMSSNIGGVTGGSVAQGILGCITNNTYNSVTSTPMPQSTAQCGSGGQVPMAAGARSTTSVINAQKNDNLVKMLAEPTVMAISGQEGSFLAGGTIFIPIAQATAGGTTITLEEKPFGVGLKFTPTVLGNGMINLKVNSEVSELNSSGVAITAPGINGTAILPTFTVRRASTTVQLQDGQSFAIGGLIKNNVNGALSAFPGLGELPIIGALFRSTDFQTDRTELVIVISPHLAKPLPTNYRTPTDDYVQPTRTELYMQGRLESAAPAPAVNRAAQQGAGAPAGAPATANAPAPAGTPAPQSDFQVK